MAGPVVVLEFNELCPPLMERFISEGALPSFRRLRDESRQYVTDAAEGPGRLNPWVQWVTVHTGVSVDVHGALRLGDARHVEQPTIGELVSAAGRHVWLCGPMNLAPRRPLRGAYLPDPWAIDAVPQPAELEPYFRFVRASVQEHSNPNATLSVRQGLAFGWFLVRHGLRPATVLATIKQLVEERFARTRWRRATLLDRYQWDVFRYYLRKVSPDLATFFSNSTAHLQHHYWRYLEPEVFEPRPTTADLADFGPAVRYGYEQMDRLVAEALELVGDDGTLVLCTALSQQAFQKGEVAGKGAFHRPHDVWRFAETFGVEGVRKVAPVMAEQFHLLFDDDDAAENARVKLAQIRLGDEPAMSLRRDGNDLFVGCAHFGVIDPATPLTGAQIRDLAFADVFYSSETGQSGMHHPDGLLWIRPPGGTAKPSQPVRVSLLDVAPTVLALLGVEPDPGMPGRALAAGVSAPD